MKTKRLMLLFAAVLVPLGLIGCSTPSTRIRSNPEAFARLSPDQQALVKNGQVGLGFSMEAVKLALGDPDRITTTTTNDGQTTVWHYTSYEADGRMLFTGYYHAGRGPWGPWYPYYLDYPDRRAHDYFRVEFRGDRVSAITAEYPS
jgi:hypothetical protein